MSVHDSSPYTAGLEHYSSPARRDAVKRLWEEPVTHAIIRKATYSMHPEEPLRVMDIGCGAGDGFQFFADALTGTQISYLGIDIDDGLLNLAKEKFAGAPRTAFVKSDIVEQIPADPVDIYFSCGVPYSHLTEEELKDALRRIFTAIRENRTCSTVVVDVLGRYSIEWAGKWHSSRWNYCMSFFSGDAEVPDSPMTFWGSQELIGCIASAARAARVTVNSVSFVDRSIMVGRHTATRDFNRNIPAYRSLVNNLFEGKSDVKSADLFFPAQLPIGPTAVAAFQQDFHRRWNSVVDQMSQGSVYVPRRVMRYLAEALCSLEHRLSPGLGVGHSLSAIVTVDQAS